MADASEQSRRIVVTGVSRGLGRALVERFAEAGHAVLGCARSADAIAELERRYGAPHAFARVDVAQARAVEAWAREILDAHGPPDLVVNNAGLINKNAPLWRVPADELESVVAVNVLGTAFVLRSFLPAMIERGRGVVVNFSSGWGRSSAPEVAPYCATKWAVEGLTQALAQELESPLAAVAVNPGVIHTEMLESCFGPAAAGHADPASWSRRAVPFLLSLGREHNGRSLSIG